MSFLSKDMTDNIIPSLKIIEKLFPKMSSENCTFCTFCFETVKWLISQLLLFSPQVVEIAISPSQKRW